VSLVEKSARGIFSPYLCVVAFAMKGRGMKISPDFGRLGSLPRQGQEVTAKARFLCARIPQGQPRAVRERAGHPPCQRPAGGHFVSRPKAMSKKLINKKTSFAGAGICACRAI